MGLNRVIRFKNPLRLVYNNIMHNGINKTKVKRTLDKMRPSLDGQSGRFELAPESEADTPKISVLF